MLGGTEYFDFKPAQTVFLVWDTASRSTKRQNMLEIWGALPLYPPWLHLWQRTPLFLHSRLEQQASRNDKRFNNYCLIIINQGKSFLYAN